MASRLDDAEWRTQQDPAGMTNLVFGLAEQAEKAWEIGQAVELPSMQVDNVVLLGMGGSAIAGDLLRSVLGDVLPVPMATNRDYHLPAYVSSRTLVIASSYAGNTEETLSAYAQAQQRGAQIIAITTGGELAQRAAGDGVPVIRIPAGLSPRAALGYSLVPLLVALHKVGLIPDQSEAFGEALEVLRRLRGQLGPEVSTAENPAKQMALRLQERLPVVYGVAGWAGVMAYRWKGQFNENSKHPAAWHEFPELNHNEIVGWEAPPEVARQIEVIMLRVRPESAQIRTRIEVTAELIRPRVGDVSFVASEGNSALAQMFSLVHWGDAVSLYLALAKGVDPTPVRTIDHLKQELAKLG